MRQNFLFLAVLFASTIFHLPLPVEAQNSDKNNPLSQLDFDTAASQPASVPKPAPTSVQQQTKPSNEQLPEERLRLFKESRLSKEAPPAPNNVPTKAQSMEKLLQELEREKQGQPSSL